MKKLTKLFAIFAMLMAGVACSEPEDYNPVIDTPTKGDSTDNSYNDKEKLSIVGSWKYTKYAVYENQTISATTTYVFNQDGSGSCSYRMPYWTENDTIEYSTETEYFTYKYEYELGVLTITIGSVTDEMTAFIVTDGEATVLHMGDTVYRKVQ